MLSVKSFSPAPIELWSIGIVDVARILSLHPSKADSMEARAEEIRKIQLAVAARAEAHNLVLIFDSSGQTMNGVRAVLSSAQSFDLTEEVIQQLGQPGLVTEGR